MAQQTGSFYLRRDDLLTHEPATPGASSIPVRAGATPLLAKTVQNVIRKNAGDNTYNTAKIREHCFPFFSMPLTFLEFDLSEDTAGLRTWSALAAPASVHTKTLHDEVQRLLEDLTRQLGTPGPLDEGHPWDFALDTETEHDRVNVSLHLTGGEALAECLNPWIGP